MSNSFFCLRLNTAGKVIGWVGAVLSIIMSISVILILVALNKTRNYYQNFKYDTDWGPYFVKEIIIYSIILVLYVVNLIASILLVAGTVMERHLMLRPWLISSGISFVLYVIDIIIYCASIYEGTEPFYIINIIILRILILGLQFYATCAVYSLYKQLQDGREEQHSMKSIQQQTPFVAKI